MNDLDEGGNALADKVENSLEDLLARLGALERQRGKDRQDSALEKQLLIESIAVLEQRLLRVENSIFFRFNRAIGNFLKSKKSKLDQVLRRWPFNALWPATVTDDIDYARWVRFNEAAFPSFEWHREQNQGWEWRPRISIVMTTHHARREWLEEAIASVQRQSYENWQLCICDEGSGEAWVEEYLGSLAKVDLRIRFTTPAAPRTVSGALNEACGLATGDYIGWLRLDGVLHRHCLHYIAEACQKDRMQAIYADEDCLDPRGRRMHPRFKPGWSPDLLTSCMYWGRFWVAERDSVERAAGAPGECFRSDFDGAQDYDLALRLTDKPLKVGHVARVLSHWRAASDQGAMQSKAQAGSRLALEDALRRRNYDATVEDGSAANTFFIRRNLPHRPLASIVVCSCNLKLFESFLTNLAAKTDYDPVELVLVEHQAGSIPFPVGRLERIWKKPVVHIPYSDTFNFAVMNNLAATAASGSVLVFLNDDVEPLHRDWLWRLLGQVQRPEVAVAGARLHYPSGAIQHAGIALGMSLDGAGHLGRSLFHSDLFPWLQVTRNVTAVTGACLCIRKEVFLELGGLDPEFPLDYNDVDLCLRARAQGYLVVYEAGALLRHRESATRGRVSQYRDSATRARVSQYRERCLFKLRWAPLLKQPDPYVPPALERKTECIRLAHSNSTNSFDDIPDLGAK